MKRLLLLLLGMFVFLPVRQVGAQVIQKHETKEVVFSLAEGSYSTTPITIKLSNGTSIVLSEETGWECRLMFMDDEVFVKDVSKGEYYGSIDEGKITVSTEQKQPQQYTRNNPKYENVTRSSNTILRMAAIGIILALAVFGIYCYRLRRK